MTVCDELSTSRSEKGVRGCDDAAVSSEFMLDDCKQQLELQAAMSCVRMEGEQECSGRICWLVVPVWIWSNKPTFAPPWHLVSSLVWAKLPLQREDVFCALLRHSHLYCISCNMATGKMVS